MEKEEIYTHIKTYLIDFFEIDESAITIDSNFYTELDLDSIDAIDLIVKLQDLTQTKIAPTEFKEVRTMRDVVDLVHNIMHR